MRSIQNSLIIIFIFLLCSCGSAIFPALKIENVTIESDIITVTFNSTPARNSLMEAFTFSCDSDSVNGDFDFIKNSLFFYPDKKIESGHDYIIEISTEAEDINGLSLSQKYIYTFTTKSEFTHPEIKNITPANEDMVDGIVEKLTIEFTESVNEKSFADSFSMKPSADYILTWNQDKSAVDVIFLKQLQLATRYTVNISTELCDLNNNFLLNKFVSTFSNGIDKTVPSYKIYELYDDNTIKELISDSVNDKVRTKSKLRIVFDEDINLSTVSSCISIKPNMSITIETDNENKKQADIIFSKSPSWNDIEYILSVSSGISDISSNEILEDKEFKIKFDHENDRPISFIKGIIKLSSETYFSICEDTNYSSFNLPPDKFPTTGGISISVPIYYFFRISDNASGINLISAMNNIFSISPTNSCIYTYFTTIEILDKSQIQNLSFDNNNEILNEVLNILDSGGNVSAVKFNATIENTDSAGQITFSINKELKDSLGNNLLTDLSYKYNKQ